MTQDPLNNTPRPMRLASSGMRRLALRLNLAAEADIDALEKEGSKLMLIAALGARGAVDEGEALRQLSAELGLPLVHLSDGRITIEARSAPLFTRLVPDIAVRCRCVPLEEKDGEAVIAMADPLDTETLRMLSFIFNCRVRAVLAPEREILAALGRLLGSYLIEEAAATAVNAAAEQPGGYEFKEDQFDSEQAGSESAPVVRLVQKILIDAIHQKASDIHLEPSGNALEVRMRVDGVLASYTTVPKNLQSYVLTRLKILSGMDITIRRRPQDGRFTVRNGTEALGDARVSSVPTAYGEKIVVRLLPISAALLSLDALGMPPAVLSAFSEVLKARDRMVIVAGPTGSGKSTTLYAAISQLRTGANNIITVEDPVEYRIGGVTQIQVDQKAGMTFASGLRSILRQDPDIIMVGEIRDAETAGIGFQAAQTGHLVLSTLHTNSAAAAVVRLLDLGIEPFIISSSLGAVLAQRLVRRLCSVCSRTLSAEEGQKLQADTGIEPANARAAAGCPACDHTGYSGRIGIYSLLIADAAVREMIRRGAGEDELFHAGRASGMTSLAEEGRRLIEQGISSLDEVERVIGDLSSSSSRKSDGAAVYCAPGGVVLCRETTASGAAGEQSAADIIRSFAESAAEAFEQQSAGLSAEPDDEDRQSVALMAKKYRDDSGARVGRGSVLLVDDDEGVRVTLSRALARAGFEVREAVDGADALEKAKENAVDVIVTDLLMPGVDGETLIAQIKQHPQAKAVPIIVLSASDSEANEVRLLKLGASDFVSKASSPAVLIARINRLLSSKG